MVRRFKVVVVQDEDGPGYVAHVPVLPGCHTQGHTRALTALGQPPPQGDVDVFAEKVEVNM